MGWWWVYTLLGRPRCRCWMVEVLFALPVGLFRRRDPAFRGDPAVARPAGGLRAAARGHAGRRRSSTPSSDHETYETRARHRRRAGLGADRRARYRPRMIIELGHFALILAFVVAIVQMVVPLVGAHKGWRGWMAVAEPAATAQFLLLLFSFAALTYAFVTSDFSLRLVTVNSHTDKPMLYKITGVWGNHEGSMLLWVLILALFGALAAWFGGNLPTGCGRACWRCRPRSGWPSSPSSSSPRTRSCGCEPPPFERAGPQPAAAGPRPRLPSAVPLPRLCRAFRWPSPSPSPP